MLCSVVGRAGLRCVCRECREWAYTHYCTCTARLEGADWLAEREGERERATESNFGFPIGAGNTSVLEQACAWTGLIPPGSSKKNVFSNNNQPKRCAYIVLAQQEMGLQSPHAAPHFYFRNISICRNQPMAVGVFFGVKSAVRNKGTHGRMCSMRLTSGGRYARWSFRVGSVV